MLEAPTTADETLEMLCSSWMRRKDRAADQKEDQFDGYADECMAFYEGTRSAWQRYTSRSRRKDWSNPFDDDYDGFRFISCKARELVDLFGPVLYDRNPVRTVSVRSLPEPRRGVYVSAELESQAQQLQQQLQQFQQQASQGAPQMPGQPPRAIQPPPQLTQQMQMVSQMLQQQEQVYQQKVMGYRQRNEAAQVRADLFSAYLNYTPNEMDLKTESRQVIDECLIKGMGCFWTDLVPVAGGDRFVVTSRYDSVDNFMFDPSAKDWSTCKWMARRCEAWIYDVAQEYGVSVEELREYATTALESEETKQERKDEEREGNQSPSLEEDMIVYWKVWSKMGFGQTLVRLPAEDREIYESFGDNVYLVIVPGLGYPLNLKPDDVEALRAIREGDFEEMPEDEEMLQQIEDTVFAQVQWPIPFHLDSAKKHAWPMTPVIYHEIPNKLWPMAHLRSGLPDLRMINHIKSRLASRAHESSRLWLAVAQDLEEETKADIASGKAVTTIPVKRSSNEKLSDLIQFMNVPQGGATELMAVAEKCDSDFKDATGLTEMMYGQMGGMRSAEEARLKEATKNVRPDDMSRRTEEAMTIVSRKEALAAAWLLRPEEDVAPILGADAAELWDQFITQADPLELAMELDIRIESGSMRKPNHETQQAQMNETMQTMGSVLTQLALSGQPGPWNGMMRQFAKVQQIPWVEDLLLPPPPPPQPDPRIQADQQKTQAELQMKQQEHQMKLQEMSVKQQMAQQTSQLRMQEQQMKLQVMAIEGNVAARKAQNELAQDRLKFSQQLEQTAEKARLDLAVRTAKAEQTRKDVAA